MLRLNALSVGYRGPRGAVLDGLDVQVEAGCFICVLGRNGAGKSTLMRTIAGLQPALSGRAVLEGISIDEMSAQHRARQIAVVLTDRIGSPGLTVDDVIALGRQPFTNWQGQLAKSDTAQIDHAIAMAGAVPLKGRYFDDLSDGERQRVMIARALAQSPRLMLLDEITAFLDLPGRVEVMSLLRAHAHRTGSVVLLSSHDLELSLQLADTVWLIDGRGLFIGPPALLIADGSVGDAFNTAEVEFSTEHGRFALLRRHI